MDGDPSDPVASAALGALLRTRPDPGRDDESPAQSLPPPEDSSRFDASSDRETLKRASVRGAAITFLSQGLRFVLQFGAQIVLAHWLLPREFGLIAMVAPVLSLVQVFNDLGLTQATIQRRMRYTQLAVIDVACAIMAFGVGLAAAALGFGYWSLVAMQAANSLTILVLAWGFSDWRPSWPQRRSGAMELLKFGSHLTGFNILGIVETNLGTVLLGRLNGAQALGLYDRAYKLVIVPWWQISLPVARVSISLLCRLHGADAPYARAFRQMLQGLLLVAGPGLIWAAIEAPSLVPRVLGPAWTHAAPIVAWLALGTIVMPVGSSAYWLFVSQNRVREQLHYGLLSGLLLVASILAGIAWGPLGVARAYAAFGPFVQGVQLWGATRRGPVTRAMVVRTLYPVALALLGAFAALAGLRAEIGVATTPVLLAETLLLSYAIAGGALLLFPDGQRIIREVCALREVLRPA
jgi:PST family polysaccharide transporter